MTAITWSYSSDLLIGSGTPSARKTASAKARGVDAAPSMSACFASGGRQKPSLTQSSSSRLAATGGGSIYSSPANVSGVHRRAPEVRRRRTRATVWRNAQLAMPFGKRGLVPDDCFCQASRPPELKPITPDSLDHRRTVFSLHTPVLEEAPVENLSDKSVRPAPHRHTFERAVGHPVP